MMVMAMTKLSIVVIPADKTLSLTTSVLDISEGANVEDLLEQKASSLLGDSTKLAPLLLPGSDEHEAGLYIYSIVPPPLNKNVRATRLVMVCGNLGTRFYGDVMLFRSKGAGRGYQDLVVDDVFGAACISPDLRSEIQAALNMDGKKTKVPDWLANAAQQNYHDNATISRLASVLSGNCNDDSSKSDSDDDSTSTEHDEDSKANKVSPAEAAVADENLASSGEQGKHFIARTSLCLHCRGPADSLCPDCDGAYFCEEPRHCRQNGYVVALFQLI